MARITVEDCIEAVKGNRFALAALAGHRAKELSKGSPVTIVKEENDKNTVTALREIAERGVSIDDLRDHYTRSLQKNAQADDVMEEDTQNVSADVAELIESEQSTQIEPSDKVDEDSEGFSVDDYTIEDENDLED